MKVSFPFTLFLIFITSCLLVAQSNLTEVEINPSNSTVFNREASFENGVAYLNAKAKDGILWLNNVNFRNGTIELDIKGRNAPGKSFVGVAFHGNDNENFEAVYFRPFNFRNPERNKYSVQYISMPKHEWSTLRQEFPGKYENTINPVPENEDDWFHAKIVVNYPSVQVYINGSDKASLVVDKISETKQGKVGFWVGNNSDGWFRNLKISANNSK